MISSSLDGASGLSGGQKGVHLRCMGTKAISFILCFSVCLPAFPKISVPSLSVFPAAMS